MNMSWGVTDMLAARIENLKNKVARNQRVTEKQLNCIYADLRFKNQQIVDHLKRMDDLEMKLSWKQNVE